MSAICPCPNCTGKAGISVMVIPAAIIAYEIVKHGNSILVAIDIGAGSIVGVILLGIIITIIRVLIRNHFQTRRTRILARIAIESARVAAPALPAPVLAALPAPARLALPGPGPAVTGLPADAGAWVPRPVRDRTVRL